MGKAKNRRYYMATSKRKSDFFDSEDGLAIIKTLKQMDKSDEYNTDSSYSSNSDLYPNNLIPFVDKHVNYLLSHPNTDPSHYMANLQLMTRIRK